jgi:hypothetical protein
MVHILSVEALITYRNDDGTPTSFPHDIPNNTQIIVLKLTAIKAIDYIEPFPDLKILYLTSNALNVFPDLSNISSTLEQLFLRNNDITVIKSIAPMSRLNTLGLKNNLLTHIPDLSNISTTLKALILTGNKIVVIESIATMLVLRKLKLNNNLLTQFPDVRNASSSLQILLLHGNDITQTPTNLVAPLVALITLTLGTSSGDPVTLPNVCVMGRDVNVLTLEMHSEYITCAWAAVYAKLAERVGRLVIIPVGVPPPICASPAALYGRNFSDVTVSDLLTQASK